MSENDFVAYITGEITKSEAGISIMNPEKVEEVEIVYNVMKSVVKGTGVQVTYELNAPYVSMGSVSVVGTDIKVLDPVLFLRVAQFASNVEVYPKVDGTVQIDFTFHELTRKVEE